MKRQTCKPVLSFLDPNVALPTSNFHKRLQVHDDQENRQKKIKLGYSAKNEKETNNFYVETTSLEKIVLNVNHFPKDQWAICSEGYKDILYAEISLENRSKVSRTFCIGSTITASHRELVVEWIIEMQNNLKIGNEVLHLAVTLMDLVLDKETILENNLQVLGAASIWISYKFYHGRIKAKNILKWCSTITQKELIEFERKVLKTIDMNVMFTNSITVLNLHLYRMFGCDIPTIAYHACNYLLEIMLLNVDFIQESVSIRTFAAIYTTLYLLKSQKITLCQEFVETKRFKLLHVRLISILRTIRDNPTFRRKSTLYKKYCSSRYSRVSANLGLKLD